MGDHLVGNHLRDAIRLERKLRAEGGNGVGPAHQTQVNGSKSDKGGRRRINLLDDLIIEEVFTDKNNITKTVTYCVGCDKRAVGRDSKRVYKHALECDVRLEFRIGLSH